MSIDFPWISSYRSKDHIINPYIYSTSKFSITPKLSYLNIINIEHRYIATPLNSKNILFSKIYILHN